LSAIIKKAIIFEKGSQAYTDEIDRAAGFHCGELVKIPDHLMSSYLGHLSGVGIIVSTWTETHVDPTIRIEVLWPNGTVINMIPSYLEHATEIAI